MASAPRPRRMLVTVALAAALLVLALAGGLAARRAVNGGGCGDGCATATASHHAGAPAACLHDASCAAQAAVPVLLAVAAVATLLGDPAGRDRGRFVARSDGPAYRLLRTSGLFHPPRPST